MDSDLDDLSDWGSQDLFTDLNLDMNNDETVEDPELEPVDILLSEYSSEGVLEHVTGPESEDEIDDEEEDLLSLDGNNEPIDWNNLNLGSRDEALETPPTPEASSTTIASTAILDGIIWNWLPAMNHQTIPNAFEDLGSGWTELFLDEDSELTIFEKVFNKEALQLCIEETNRYSNLMGDCTTKRWDRWTDVTDAEFMKFLAVRMLMGLNKKPKIKQYWSRDPLYCFPIIGNIMSQDRYCEILKYLHFCNNEEQVTGDRLFKIRKIWDITNKNFQNLLTPHKNLSIDESLILHKGRLFFKQFIPSKRSRFGIKTFSIVDEETRFILNSIIYAGKNHELKYSTKEYGYGGAITMELLEPYLNLQHHLYCDNWFTSPNLAFKLLKEGTYICGTLRKSRKNIPAPKDKMKKGDVIAQSSNGILVEFWRDKKVVRMISTMHDHEMQEVQSKNSPNSTFKPKSVLEYNKYARGIDLGDMMMHLYTMRRKTSKWYKKLFFHLVDICIYNAFRIFKCQHPSITFMDFRANIVRQIVEKYGTKEARSTHTSGSTNNPIRLSGRHFPEFNPPTKNKKHGGRKCRVCLQNKTQVYKKETVYQCGTCQVPLCPVPCFEIYHTRKNL